MVEEAAAAIQEIVYNRRDRDSESNGVRVSLINHLHIVEVYMGSSQFA